MIQQYPKILFNSQLKLLIHLILFIFLFLFLINRLLSFSIVTSDMMKLALVGIENETLCWRIFPIVVYALVFPVRMTIPMSVKYIKYLSTTSMNCLAFFKVIIIYECCGFCSKNEIYLNCKTFKFILDIFSPLSKFGLKLLLPVVF